MLKSLSLYNKVLSSLSLLTVYRSVTKQQNISYPVRAHGSILDEQTKGLTVSVKPDSEAGSYFVSLRACTGVYRTELGICTPQYDEHKETTIHERFRQKMSSSGARR